MISVVDAFCVHHVLVNLSYQQVHVHVGVSFKKTPIPYYLLYKWNIRKADGRCGGYLYHHALIMNFQNIDIDMEESCVVAVNSAIIGIINCFMI